MFRQSSTHFYSGDNHLAIHTGMDGETGISCTLYDKGVLEPPAWKGTLEELIAIILRDKQSEDRQSDASRLETAAKSGASE